MKIFFILLTALSFSSILFGADFPPGLYLDVREIGCPIDAEPIMVMIPVTDRNDALAKLPGVVSEHFSGKTYEAKLHYHYTDQPCVMEVLP